MVWKELGGEVTMGGVVIPRVKKFKYLGLIIENKGDVDDDINHRIRLCGKNGEMHLAYYETRKFL